jgi:hypothetical protein
MISESHSTSLREMATEVQSFTAISASRDMTAFYCLIGLLRLTSLPIGFTNSPSEFQECMVFIDDAPICGPLTTYPDENGTLLFYQKSLKSDTTSGNMQSTLTEFYTD